MVRFSRSIVVMFVIAVLALSGCGGFFVSNSATDHITLSGTALLLSASGSSGTPESKQITATAVTVGGSSSDVTNSATWTTGSAAIATVSTNGTITAVGAGTTQVTAKSGGTSASVTVIVVTSAIGAFNVNPSSVAMHLTSGPTTQQLSAIVTLGSGTVDVTQSATWTTDNSSVATVNTKGLVTAQPSTSILTSSTANITAAILTASSQLTAKSAITVDSL